MVNELIEIESRFNALFPKDVIEYYAIFSNFISVSTVDENVYKYENKRFEKWGTKEGYRCIQTEDYLCAFDDTKKIVYIINRNSKKVIQLSDITVSAVFVAEIWGDTNAIVTETLGDGSGWVSLVTETYHTTIYFKDNSNKYNLITIVKGFPIGLEGFILSHFLNK